MTTITPTDHPAELLADAYRWDEAYKLALHDMSVTLLDGTERTLRAVNVDAGWRLALHRYGPDRVCLVYCVVRCWECLNLTIAELARRSRVANYLGARNAALDRYGPPDPYTGITPIPFAEYGPDGFTPTSQGDPERWDF